MREDVIQRSPEEACGLLLGMGDQVEEVFPITNVLHSPTGFRMDPQEQYNIFKTMEERGWELLAIYHSHPEGPPHPSSTDIAEAYYPGVVHLIWSGLHGEWICRSYLIHSDPLGNPKEETVSEVPLYLME